MRTLALILSAAVLIWGLILAPLWYALLTLGSIMVAIALFPPRVSSNDDDDGDDFERSEA